MILAQPFSISVIMPTYNEKENVCGAVSSIKNALEAIRVKYEILLIDDGSTDGTSKIIDALSKKSAHIRVIHHTKNLGFANTIKSGIKEAKYLYITQCHSDNDVSPQSFINMIKQSSKADLIMLYIKNSHARSTLRRLISRTYVILLNSLFGLKIRYFNGAFLCKKTLLQSIELKSNGFAIYSEAKIRLLTMGCSFIEVPAIHKKRKYGVSKAISLQSVKDTIITMMTLLIDTRFFYTKRQ